MKRVLIILVLVMLAACQQQVSKEDARPFADFRTGSQGLIINFAPNLPPFQMYEQENFNAVLEIKNIGAAEVGGPGDRIYLSGFDNRIITGIPSTGIRIPQIEGKNQFNLRGGYDQVNFNGIIHWLQSDSYPAPILATTCYEYETIASETVCIDPDPFGPRLEAKACRPTSIAAGNQGAPIAVTRIEVEPRKSKTLFRIHLSNVGGGDVFRNGLQQLSRCGPYDSRGLGFDDLDYVELTNVEVGGVGITQTCKPTPINGHIPIRGGQGIVTCEFFAQGTSAYVTPITITLRYGYRNVIRKDITIYKVS